MTDLEKALITIRGECKSHVNCEGCPLVIDDEPDMKECYLTHYTPDRYVLKCDDPQNRKVYIY